MRTQFILNPESGRADRWSLEKRIRRAFSGLPFDLQWTSGPGHATELARSASEAGACAVVAVGGDGIVNEVLNGIIGTGAALGVIPTGTANDLARHLGISDDLPVLRGLIRDRRTTTIDAIEINGRLFLTAGGTGLVCEAARRANGLKGPKTADGRPWALTGSRLYIFAALMALASKERRPRPVSLQIDGRWIVADPLWIAVSNQPRLGRYFLVSPQANNQDGYFNVCMAENTRSRGRDLITMIGTLAGKHENMKGVSVFRSREMIVRAPDPVGFMGDGELLCESTELRIRVRPLSVRILASASQQDVSCHQRGIRRRITTSGGGYYENTA